MFPDPQRALVELSCLFHPDPGVIYQRILEIITDRYPGTMAMLNLIQDGHVSYRAVLNPDPRLQHLTSLALTDSYCQFVVGPVCPLLIQDAAAEACYQDHPGVRLGLTRYLGVPVRNSFGEVLGTLCFLDARSDQPLGREDIELLSLLAMRASAELERERMLRERVAVERRTAEQLREVNEQLVAAAELKRRFMLTVVHDLRQPLASMRTLVHLLGIEDDPTDRAESLALLDRGACSMSGMVDELLTYARIESGHIPWSVDRIDVAEFLGELLAGFTLQAESRGVRLTLDAEPDFPAVHLDRVHLTHLVTNLVSNAIKFTAGKPEVQERRDGRVTVRVRSASPDRWLLEVEDNGLGMSPSVQERIFEEFYQSPDSRACERRADLPPGRGLGMTIVRHLTARMGVPLTVRTRLGEGTWFGLALPWELVHA
ncbi:MAG: histidine kinase [Armatimonadetes bacterium]|nr:histidine kinase [Armatimonadota bacterium]